MEPPLRVHIAPVGFNIRRVADPLIREHADKVYLVCYSKDEVSTEYERSILQILKDEHPTLKVEVVKTDLWDLFECLNVYKKILSDEKQNHVYINVSTGSKVASIAGTLACMIWKGTPYYARIEYRMPGKSISKLIDEKVTEIDELPVYSINTPKAESIKVLEILDKNKGKMKKRDLIGALESAGMIDTNLSIAAKHSRLKGLLDPIGALSDNPLIDVEYKGRQSTVTTTKQGKQTLRIFRDR